MERFEDTATEDEEEEFIAMQAVDRDTVDEVASEIEEEELPLGSKKAVSLEKPKNMTVHPKSEEERNRGVSRVLCKSLFSMSYHSVP